MKTTCYFLTKWVFELSLILGRVEFRVCVYIKIILSECYSEIVLLSNCFLN